MVGENIVEPSATVADVTDREIEDVIGIRRILQNTTAESNLIRNEIGYEIKR